MRGGERRERRGDDILRWVCGKMRSDPDPLQQRLRAEHPPQIGAHGLHGIPELIGDVLVRHRARVADGKEGLPRHSGQL